MQPITGVAVASDHDTATMQDRLLWAYGLVRPEGTYVLWFLYSMVLIQTVFQLFSRTLYAGKTDVDERKRAWIITTFAALVVSLVSIPYVVDFLYMGMDWTKVTPHRESISDPVCTFFIAYLVSDLLTGLVYYRRCVNLTSGWLHHSIYAVWCVCWIKMNWSHAFATGAALEIPTWVMGLGVLNPKLRSYWAFTLSFLATRIGLHACLFYSFALPSGRWVDQSHASRWPLVFAAVSFPMHVVWAYKSIRGLYRRKLKLAREATARDLERLTAIDEATKLLDSAEQLQGDGASQEARARRLVSKAVYKLWYIAPEAWRQAYTDELNACKQQGIDLGTTPRSTLVRRTLQHQLLDRGKRGHNLPLVHEDDEDDLDDWMSVTSLAGPAGSHHTSTDRRKVSLGKGIQIVMPRELDPILNGQNYIVSEFPVDQQASGTRRQRLVGQMRRRFEVARRDMVVF